MINNTDCPYCQMDTAGEHECGCPAKPRKPGLWRDSIKVGDDFDAPHLMGWICPKCGGGNSPWTTTCPHCAPSPKITCNQTEWGALGTSGGEYHDPANDGAD